MKYIYIYMETNNSYNINTENNIDYRNTEKIQYKKYNGINIFHNLNK